MAFVAITLTAFVFASYNFYALIGPFMIEKALPFLINNLPSIVFRYAGMTYQFIVNLYNNQGIIFLMGLMSLPFLTRAQANMLWNLWMALFSNIFQSMGFFVVGQCASIGKAVWDISEEIGCYFRNVARDNTDRMNKLRDEKILKVWNDIFPKQAA